MKNIKDFLKKYLPQFLLSFLKIPYRPYVLARNALRLRRIIALADKYRLYYTDELSQRILSDFEHFKLTRDTGIFTNRARELGWKYHDLNYHTIPEDEFSGIAVVHDGKDAGRYVKSLLSMCNWRDRHRFISLKQFLEGEAVGSQELIVPVLKDRKSRSKFFRYAEQSNLLYTRKIYCLMLYSTRDDIQYFDMFSPCSNEIIVCAGCYDGATVLQFLEWGSGKVKKIYAFEFDPLNAHRCEERLKAYSDKVILVQKGTWDKDETVYVKANGTSTSVSSIGEIKAYLTAIDSIVKDDKVTFIQLDVEGAELKSLMGARNTITKNRPRLAISVYHKNEDIYEIPEYILSLVPEYKFHMRHYSSREYEVVLYAYC